MLALSLLACSCAAAGALSPLRASPAVTLRRAGASASSETLARCGDTVGASCLRLKGGQNRGGNHEKTDVEMADAEAIKATLKKVISKNRPVAQQSTSDDNSIISMNPKRMEDLGFFNGDTVLIKGRRSRETVCVVVPEEKMEEDDIRLPKNVLDWLRLTVNDDRCKVSQFPDIKNAKRVHVLPFKHSLGTFEGDVFDVFLKPYFFENYRPVHAGEVMSVYNEELDTSIMFKIMQVDDEDTEYGVVAPETVVYTEGDPLEREADPAYNPTEIGFDDIGGLSKQIAQLRELVETPLKHPELFETVGINPPRCVLLHGPPGCGKTMIGQALATESGAFFFLINGPEVISGKAGESEGHLRRCFEEAEKNQPAIIWIDEVDTIAPKREKANSESEKRIVSQMLTLMDSITADKQIMVVAATNKPNDIDGALRRFGRFSKEIEVVSPDEDGRWEILKIKTRNMALHEDVDIRKIAHDTHGYTGGDLAQLALEAGLQAVRGQLHLIDVDADELDEAVCKAIKIRMCDMEHALSKTHPSSLRDKAVEIPDTTWGDVGGLEKVKQELMETVMYPVEYAHKYAKFGMNPSKGVLLYGPSGCGKTLMAKAIANEAKTNFISVKGPELLSMWMGESESNVRDLFAKARGAAPCILFFDEIDSIAKPRGSGGGASEAGDRIVNQILTEMDGVGARKNVICIGATNRPDMIDPAVCRPGRLDQLVYIPVPDKASRVKIFESCLRKSPLDTDVDINVMADETDGFSGADLNEICQRACKLAIREEIRQWTDWAQTQEDVKNPTTTFESKINHISARHFEESFKFARRSVTDKDVRKYEVFRQKMLAAASGANDKIGGGDGGDGGGGSGVDLEAIANMGGTPAPGAAAAAEEEDLYA